MKCPNCGANLPEDSRFCFDCGAEISQPSPPSRPAPPPPPRYTTSAPAYRPPARKHTWAFLALGAVLGVALLAILVLGAGGLYYVFFSGSQPTAPAALPSEVIAEIQPTEEVQASLPTAPVPVATLTPVPSPTIRIEKPCSNGALLLEDNFNSEPPVAEPFFSEPIMRFWQNQQSGIIQSVDQPEVVLPVIYPNLQVTDFNIEFSATPGNLKEDGSYGLIFRSGLSNNTLTPYYLVAIQPNLNKVVFSTWIDPDWSETTRVDLAQGVLGMGGGSQVRLEVLQDRFRLFVNDTYVTTFQSQALSNAGLIGLVLLPSPAAATRAEEAWFGNLMIFKPGGCE